MLDLYSDVQFQDSVENQMAIRRTFRISKGVSRKNIHSLESRMGVGPNDDRDGVILPPEMVRVWDAIEDLWRPAYCFGMASHHRMPLKACSSAGRGAKKE